MTAGAAARGWPFPGVVWGEYPEQAAKPGKRGKRLSLARLEAFARSVLATGTIADADLADRIRALPRLTADPDAWLHEATVLATSALTHTVGYVPHRQQLMAARALLDERLAEMATGEGKTAAIAIAAAVGALARTPVHVVTANDYLAQRDADALRPFYARLGLTVDCVTQPMEAAQRRSAYAANVTYCTAKELAFDYLRDGLARASDLSPLEQRARRLAGTQAAAPVLRGLCMAILDEADTVLIDEARVPLVLAQTAGGEEEGAFYRHALQAARGLAMGLDFQSAGDRRYALTLRGRQRLGAWPTAQDPLLAHRAHREAAVEMALVALHQLHRDRDYVLRDDQVMLVDETTGRAAPGRAWSAGLHQLVEWKEGVAATRRNSTMTQITFQSFFPRYVKLAGASGTLAEARGELRQVYGLDVVVIPRREPWRVRQAPLRLLPDSAALWQAVAHQAAAVAGEGRAVLVGTETVEQTEALSSVLRAAGMEHQVLHARQDQEESRLIAAAGAPGRITVATSMAGRGTDILCAPEVLERGGLHVILCQVNASARIDRQFLGRAGRQGQPGTVSRLAAADFRLLAKWWRPAWLSWVGGTKPAGLLANITVRVAQRRESFTNRNDRVKLSRIATSLERDLAFSRQVQHE